MKIKLIAGLIAAFFAATLFTVNIVANAEAASRYKKKSQITHVIKKKKKGVVAKKSYRKYATKNSARKYAKLKGRKSYARHGKHRKHYASRGASQAARNNVVAIIKGSAPSYGVPTWFALRIAKVESNYNPRARGSAGEYGVFQLKCSTARGIGFRGDCSQLLNPHTNVQYGLKHLSMALRLSGGNLRLAASKHNGGLGRKRIVPRYVSAVF
jgi:soluble lytic murein transglycosylase-like protein